MTRGTKAGLTVAVIFMVLTLCVVLLTRSMITSAQAEAARQTERWRTVVATVDEELLTSPAVWPGFLPDAENAAVPLRALQTRFNALSGRDQEAIKGPGIAELDVPRIREVLLANPGLLEDALEACARPAFRPDGMTIDALGIDGDVGDLLGLRTAMRVVAAAAQERADRGDLHGASDMLQQGMRLTDHVRRLPMLIAGILALAGDHLVLDGLERIAQNHLLPDEAQWTQRLDPDFPRDLMRAALIGETEIVVWGMEELPGASGPIGMLGAMIGFSPKRSQARYLEAMAESLGQLSLPFAEQDWTVPLAIVGNDRLAGMFFPALAGASSRTAERSRQRAALRSAFRARLGEPSSGIAEELSDPVSGDPLRTVIEGGRVRVEVGPDDAPEVLLDWPLAPGRE